MSFMSENPCGKRPANATECARRFAIEFVRKNKSLPSRTDIATHIQEFKTYSKVGQSNIVAAAIGAAKLEMQVVFPRPMKFDCYLVPWKALFSDMGFLLDFTFCYISKKWNLTATYYRTKGTSKMSVKACYLCSYETTLTDTSYQFADRGAMVNQAVLKIMNKMSYDALKGQSSIDCAAE